jgi:hypothetical protein
MLLKPCSFSHQVLDRLLDAALSEGAHESEAALAAEAGRTKLRRLDASFTALELSLAKRASSEVLRGALTCKISAWFELLP